MTASSTASAAVSRTLIDLSKDRSIALAQIGAGPDCLLIHGTMMTLEDMWLGLAPTLSSEFRVTAMDRPGHGYSRRRRLVDASPWRQAALMREAALRAGLRRPIVVGHSYGGTVALAYAMLYPNETKAVVALAPMCLPDARIESLLFGPRAVPGFGEALAAALAGGSDRLMLPFLWEAMFLPQTMPRAVAEHAPFEVAGRPDRMVAEGEDALALLPAVAALAASYASCRVPVHILGGNCDAVVNNAVQGQIAAALVPGGRFTWIAGCGHMLHHFAQATIRDACRNVSPGSAAAAACG